jgi:hypothetical protein
MLPVPKKLLRSIEGLIVNARIKKLFSHGKTYKKWMNTDSTRHVRDNTNGKMSNDSIHCKTI